MDGLTKEIHLRILHKNANKERYQGNLEVFKFKCTSFDDILTQLRLNYEKTKTYDFYNINGLKLSSDDFETLQDKQLIYASPTNRCFDVLSYLDEYQIIRELGRGGFGTVYFAKHKILREYRAIKIVKGSEVDSAEEFAKLFQEVKVLTALDHKGIVKMYCSFSYHGKIIIVMEYIHGKNLREYVDSGKILTEENVKCIMQQLVELVYYCHQRNYVHRDLKLDNIIVVQNSKNLSTSENEPQIKLIDFGIARKYNEIASSGTLTYSPPEIISGKNLETDPAIDIWALGVILYKLTFGKFPFSGKTREETRLCITSQEIKNEENKASKLCWDLISKMLEKSRENRIKLEDVISHPFLRYSTGETPCQKADKMNDYNEEKTVGFAQEISPMPTNDTKDLELNKIIKTIEPECIFTKFIQRKNQRYSPRKLVSISPSKLNSRNAVSNGNNLNFSKNLHRFDRHSNGTISTNASPENTTRRNRIFSEDCNVPTSILNSGSTKKALSRHLAPRVKITEFNTIIEKGIKPNTGAKLKKSEICDENSRKENFLERLRNPRTSLPPLKLSPNMRNISKVVQRFSLIQ